MKNFMLGNLFVALVVILAFAPQSVAVKAQTLVPLAYIDNTGNVRLVTTGNDPGTAITQDADFKLPQSSPLTHYYTHLRWSPDGSKLAFQDSVTGNLLVASLGKAPQIIASHVAAEYPPAWLPDSNTIAYVVGTQQTAGTNGVTMSIQQVSSSGGQPAQVGSFTESVGCGGGGSDPAYILYMQETALNGNFLTFAWTNGGWLYSTACTGLGIALNNATNQQQWKIDNVGRVVVSPSGTQAAAVLFSQPAQPSSLIYIDLTTGRNGALNAGAAVDQVSWLADETAILYSTIDGQNVSLWKIPTQGTQATQLFADQGKYIGVITSNLASDTAVFSYIPGGDNPQTQILSVPFNRSIANRSTATTVAQGGRPEFAITRVPTHGPTLTPTNTPVPAVASCTPRTDWPVAYTVVPGDTLSSLAQRTGTTVDVLTTGNCLANANIIFVGQVLHVPVAPPPPIANIARRIVFPGGATSVIVQGQVAASGIDRWVLAAQAGQTMTAQLAFTSGQAILVVIGADGTVLQTDHAGASNFAGALPSTQDYFIDVRGNPNSATSYSLTITVPPPSVPQPVAKRIVFPPGATSVIVQGQVAASGIDRWVLAAQAGQTMTAQLAFTSGQAILIVFGADGSVLISDHAQSSSFSGALPLTQDYFIDVRGNPNGPTNYSLTITVPPPTVPQPVAKRIVFPPGATTVAVQGQVAASGADRWILAAQAGQTMTAQLSFSSGQAILIVFGADGNVLLSDHATASTFTGMLPSTQDYFIDVRGNPNSSTSYTLTITIPPR